MSWYERRCRWRHRRQAKGRHGTHSPFVYRFVDEALRPPLGGLPLSIYQTAAGRPLPFPEHPHGLMQRILSYFGFEAVVVTGGRDTETYTRKEAAEPRSPLRPELRRLYDLGDTPADWLPEFTGLAQGVLSPDDALIVHRLYRSPAHTAAWDRLRQRLEVRMSIDLFDIGLLFFADEFKVPQHFQLKYPV